MSSREKLADVFLSIALEGTNRGVSRDGRSVANAETKKGNRLWYQPAREGN